MTVLMTGGTGFLGLHLLRDRLRAGQHVHLLAHAGCVPAHERVRRFLDATGDLDLLARPLSELLTVTDTDVAQPRLGLDPERARALVRGCTEVWHVAAKVALDARAHGVWPTNVTGTRHLLELLGDLPGDVPFRHVSTAFVAGARRTGLVGEADSAGVTTFENPYEHSKHTAERLVARWAARTGHRALVLRPSVLVPGDAPGAAALPEHTLRSIGRILTAVARVDGEPGSRLSLRVGADPRAHLNLLPVDWAALAMHRIAGRVEHTDGPAVRAVHVVHPRDVGVRTLAAAAEDLIDVRIRMMPSPPRDPGNGERRLTRQAAGFLPYLFHRRTFDPAAMTALLGDLAPPPDVDRARISGFLEPTDASMALLVRRS